MSSPCQTLQPDSRCVFEANSASLAQVRRFVDAALPGHPLLNDVRAVVNELAANACEHTGTPSYGVQIEEAGAGRIEVTVDAELDDDHRTAAPRVCRTANLEDENHRGLLMVEVLSDSWTYWMSGSRQYVSAVFTFTS